MEDEFGSIGLTREQFRELVLNYVIGMHVRRAALGAAAEPDSANLDAPELLEEHLLSFAAGFEAEDLVARTENGLRPSPALEEICHEILNYQEDASFWDRLADDLAWRDFLATLPPSDRDIVADSGLKPPTEFFRKYEKELAKFGADRLVIDENLPGLED